MYILIHSRICGQVSKKTFLPGQFPETRLPVFLPYLHVVKTLTIYMLKRQNVNLAHFQSYKGPFKSDCQILKQPKSMNQILQGTVLLLTISLLGNIFTLIFLCLTSIVNIKTKYALFVMTATSFFNVKRLFKNNYHNASSRIVTFF